MDADERHRIQILFTQMGVICQCVINLGFGKYLCDVPPQNRPRISFWGAGVAGCFTNLAIVWSKTSFGITILRLTKYKLRAFVLGVVVAMNIAMVLQAVFVWVGQVHSPLQELEPQDARHLLESAQQQRIRRVFGGLFRRLRHFLRDTALASGLESANPTTGENRRRHCHEHGCFVRALSAAAPAPIH